MAPRAAGRRGAQLPVTQVTRHIPAPGHDAGVERETEAGLVRSAPPRPGGRTMNIRPNTVIVSLAALWILMGLFGGLIYLAGPTHQDAQPLKAYSTPPWVHA